MKINSVGYHTRLRADNTVKVVGGSFGGILGIDTANRLVHAHFTVRINALGHPVFVDRKGREVSLYMSIDPESTEAGQAALAQYRNEKAKLEMAEQAKREQVQELVDLMDTDELLRLLQKGDK